MSEKLKTLRAIQDASGGVYLAKDDVVRLMAEVRQEARAEGFARAREMAKDTAIREVCGEADCDHISCGTGERIATRIRAMQDDTGVGT